MKSKQNRIEFVPIMTELKKQKREIQELKRDLAQQCMNQGGIVVGNDCLKN